MAIPLAYNLRNLTVRKTTTLMTALGIALTVAVLVAVPLALVGGLQSAFQASGNPLNILVMRKGANAELSGGMSREAFETLKAKLGIARGADGLPQASLELVTVINLPSDAHPDGMNITLRGLTQVGLDIREKNNDHRGPLVPSRPTRSSRQVHRETLPRRSARQEAAFRRGDWEVVGVMDSESSATNSEIYADLNQMAGDFNRQDSPSSALIRATDTVAAQALVNSINDDQRMNSNARTEFDYMDSQTSSAAPVQYLGIFVAIIMAVGSSFAAMNTMYAAVARRSKEVGTLRVLGFSRGSILISFFIESVLLSLLGGVIGCLIVLPLNSVTTGLMSFTSFSEIAFNFRVVARRRWRLASASPLFDGRDWRFRSPRAWPRKKKFWSH